MDIILTTKEQLNELIESAMRRVVSGPEAAQNIDEKSNLRLEEAVHFLNESGYKVSKSLLYSLTYRRLIPFKKFGSSLVFCREELIEWAKSRSKSVSDSEQINLLVQSAKRKPLYSKK